LRPVSASKFAPAAYASFNWIQFPAPIAGLHPGQRKQVRRSDGSTSRDFTIFFSTIFFSAIFHLHFSNRLRAHLYRHHVIVLWQRR
jgi:hypothetical protein